jgi:DNA/RNA-binding domain of Phe-tRNA-synthetase-like protein
MKDISFTVSDEASELGVKALAARIINVRNAVSNPEFETYKNSELENIKKQWIGKKYKEDPILVGFRDLHQKIGRSNRDYVASPEVLRRLFLDRDRFSTINLIVDIYNLVSLRSGLALGAHDASKIQGNITLRFTKGDEIFIPLSSMEPMKIFPGEYGYVDDANNIICRMEVLQVEPTKVNIDTTDLFVIVEGNANVNNAEVRKVIGEVSSLITKFCGGKCSFLNSL